MVAALFEVNTVMHRGGFDPRLCWGQRKLSHTVAGLAAVGSPLDRREIRGERITFFARSSNPTTQAY
jgi:hypothetical protein